MRWVVLAILIVLLASGAMLAVQYMPEGGLPIKAATYPAGDAGSSAEQVKGGKGKARAVLNEAGTFDFGTMPQEATGSHTWVVKNEGQGDLDLWIISSTCSCTLAKFKNGEKATIKPGESTELTLEYETRTNTGDYSKGATIGTNDPSMPKFDLYVHGHVYPPIITIPPEGIATLPVSYDKDETKAFVAIFSKDRPETKILDIKTSRPEAISATHAPLTEQDRQELHVESGEKIEVHVKPVLPLGIFSEELIVHTDHPSMRQVKVRVSGRMSGPINLNPDRLILHNADSSAGARAELTITARNNRETTFEVASAPKGVKVEITPTALKGRYKFAVVVPPGTPAQDIEDEVVLRTDHPKAERLVVPVSIWVVNTQ
jgi:hypothetical protein